MKLIFLVISLACIGLMGCQAMGDHFNCMAQVDRTVPVQTQQKYIRTDTKCNTNDLMATTTKGSQYMGSSTTNCTSTPIYETIVLNQAERDAAYQQCRSGINNQRSEPVVQTSYSGAYVPASPLSPASPKTKISVWNAFTGCWNTLQARTNGTIVYEDILILYPTSQNKKKLLNSSAKLTGDQISILRNYSYENRCINQAIDSSYSYVDMRKVFQVLYDTNRTIYEKYLNGDLTIGQANQQRLKNLNQFVGQMSNLVNVIDKDWQVQGIDAPTKRPSTSNSVVQDTQSVKSNQAAPSNLTSMEQAKQKCLDLGFKAGTESFGQCILKVAK